MKNSVLQAADRIIGEPLYVDDKFHTLHFLSKHSKLGDIIFEDYPGFVVTQDMHVHYLVEQAFYIGQLIQRYIAYRDERGRMHIVNASQLKKLVEEVGEATSDSPRLNLILRRLSQANVHFMIIDHQQKSGTPIEVAEKLGLFVKNYTGS